MKLVVRAAAGVAALGLIAAPFVSPAAWGQAQGSRQTTPPLVSQPVAPPPAKLAPPKPAPPKAAPIPAKSAPAPIARPAPKPAAPVTTPVARPAPRPVTPPVVTPTVQPTPRPPTIATTPIIATPPIIATAPSQSPVAGCTGPGQPAVPAQTADVSLGQMDATRTAAIAYFAAADAYRGCLDRFIEAERDKMFKSNTAETPELKRAAYEHNGFSEEKGRVYEAFTLFCYNWQSTNQREYPGGCQLLRNPGG